MFTTEEFNTENLDYFMPQAAKEWTYESNNKLQFYQFLSCSKKKAMWKCRGFTGEKRCWRR